MNDTFLRATGYPSYKLEIIFAYTVMRCIYPFKLLLIYDRTQAALHLTHWRDSTVIARSISRHWRVCHMDARPSATNLKMNPRYRQWTKWLTESHQNGISHVGVFATKLDGVATHQHIAGAAMQGTLSFLVSVEKIAHGSYRVLLRHLSRDTCGIDDRK